MPRCKVYLSDEGFGHIVRQRAVLEELRRVLPDLHVTVQTEAQAAAASRFISGARLIKKYNNITWDKQPNGSPDLLKIKERFVNYLHTSSAFIADDLQAFDYDFVISDFVYEAFESAARSGIPSFGVAHFTWDWFFSKLYPPAVHSDVIGHFMHMASKATRLYFPPFTPEEILHHYRDKALEVPLILRSGIQHKTSHGESKFKVLMMDSGAGVIGESIQKALKAVAPLDDFLFFASEKFATGQANLRTLPANDLMVDYVADMDLVIGRAGFNTISECVGLRTPMLLIGEAMNPEMNENILMLKKQNLGSFISMPTFERDLDVYLPAFLKHEYKHIKHTMDKHEIATTGAEMIVHDMLNYLP
ncbi:MAG: glycosyltransferase family protein [Flavobacteriales bacterium]